MRIIDYFRDDRQPYWRQEIAKCDWGAAAFLARLLTQGFHDTLGWGSVYLLAEGDQLVSFLTLTQKDCVPDDTLYPWIGFVYTSPAYRGRRCAGVLLDHAVAVAGEHGADRVWLATDHIGLYEKYGFEYVENRLDYENEDSRIYCRRPQRPPVRIELLSADNFREDSLDDFVRRQVVTECYRQGADGWKLMPVAFVEDWDAARRRQKAAELLRMAAEGKPIALALAGSTVVGYAALGERLGSRGQYMDLDSFHVSGPWRGRGVGRRLFEAAADAARRAGAEKLYISAHSAKETQAAYRALGCVHAREIDPAHASAEPCDVQLEYAL